MRNDKNASRRNFIKQSSLGLGAGIVGFSHPFTRADEVNRKQKLRCEICVTGIDLKGLRSDTIESRVKQVLQRMEGVAGMKPDVICLPELFSTKGVKEQKALNKVAEDESTLGPVTSRIAEFAKENNCYVVCPLITKKGGKFYNSSLLISREGAIAGVYHKIRPGKSEILPNQDYTGGGITPGALDQPIIETDFGKAGMQMGDDANWSEGWDNIKEKGAEIVFLSSTFSGGRMLNYYALKNHYYIVSSTKADARVIDISGNDLDVTSDFVRCAWATINMEKVDVVVWPTNGQLPRLFKKYSDRLGVKVWGNTDVITIESHDPQLRVADVIKEFGIQSYSDLLKQETEFQEKHRQVMSKK